jgi:signal transduction histidine kinase/CheY-like chemotaxis protein
MTISVMTEFLIRFSQLADTQKLRVGADFLIALACLVIPCILAYFFWQRKSEIRFKALFSLLVCLLIAAMFASFADIVNVTSGDVFYLALARTALAFFASALAVVLLPMLPRALSVPSTQLLAQKNRELAFANDKYNLLLEGSGVGVYEWLDLENPKSSLFWSARMYELLGFEPFSFSPTLDFYLSLIHPDDRPIVHDSLRASVHGESVDPLEYRIRVRHEYRWFRARRVKKMNDGKRVEFIIGSIEDIHEQKVTQEKIRSMNLTLEDEISKRTLQLELASKAKTRFLANMSHEMRTPLGLVLGFSDLLRENASLDSEAKEYVGLISKNGEILARVINDLLDLSKIEAGKLRFQYSKVNLSRLMEDFRKTFSARAANKGIELRFENKCPESESVITDEIRLKQIVYNLLSNAIKYTDRGIVQLVQGRNNGVYFIDVIDTGTGIPDAEREKLFQEYVRGEMADSSKTTGTGLGLRLAQNLANALGGKVEIISTQVGKGSHFRLTYISDEMKLQRQNELRQEAAVATRLHSFDIFVLDDNEDNIRLAEIFLRKLGCRVRGFTSPKSLFAEMTSLTPDLILLDINMPEMSGFEVFDRLRDMQFRNPIWALTAYSLNEDIQAIMEHGFDDYIRKPLSADLMKKKLTFELKEKVHD